MAEKTAKPQAYKGQYTAAKAGRRKIYAGGRRKVKSFEPSKGFMMSYDVKPTMQNLAEARRGDKKALRDNMTYIDRVQHNTPAGSDPFIFDRMRARAKAGLFDKFAPFEGL